MVDYYVGTRYPKKEAKPKMSKERPSRVWYCIEKDYLFTLPLGTRTGLACDEFVGFL